MDKQDLIDKARMAALNKFVQRYHASDKDYPVIEQAALYDGFEAGYEVGKRDTELLKKHHEIVKGAVQFGFDMANDKAANAEPVPWVKIEGPESLPKRSKIYWVTQSDGKVTKSAFYVGAFDKDAIAWMPDDPPPPYEESNEA